MQNTPGLKTPLISLLGFFWGPTSFEPDAEAIGETVHKSVVRRDQIGVQYRGIAATGVPKRFNIRLLHCPRLASQFDGVIQQDAIHGVDLRARIVTNQVLNQFLIVTDSAETLRMMRNSIVAAVYS